MLSLNKTLWSFEEEHGGLVEVGDGGWPNYLSCCDEEWLDLSDSDPRLQSGS